MRYVFMTVLPLAALLSFAQHSGSNALPAEENSEISAAVLKTHNSLQAVLPDFDFDARCGVVSFELVYVSSRQDPIVATNQGEDFSVAVQRLIQRAKSGDYYYFEEIRALCPGDPATRKLAGFIVKIK